MTESMPLVVGDPNDALTWWADPRDTFYLPDTTQKVSRLRTALHSLPDGSTLPIRGRNFANEKFDYGVAVKASSRLFFINESGDVESFPIDYINFSHLVHFVSERKGSIREEELLHQNVMTDLNHLVVIRHGYSPQVGPDYPLVRTLEAVARSRGWRMLVPDYRESYSWDHSRGREARVRILFQELLCLEEPKPRVVVLAGHSQGGACSAYSARDQRLVKAVGIRGLFMLGPESALRHDKMKQPPALDSKDIRIVHADVDGVISHSEVEGMVKRWKLPSSGLVSLRATTVQGSQDCWGDDIAHDFLSKQLIVGAVAAFESFLSQYEE